MNKKLLILLCLILFIVSTAGVSAADDANQTIAEDTNDFVKGADALAVSLSNDDDFVGSDGENGTFTELQNEINDAPENSTIFLEKDYVYNSGFTNYGININKVLTIEGNGHVIDALGQSRIFEISAPTVTLNNITFKNGYKDAYNEIPASGGAIIFEKSIYNCSITSCTFINNTGTRCGSAIYFLYNATNLTISSVFINNRANIYGDASIYNGGALCFKGSVFLSNISGIFIGNSAGDDGAGAIFIYDVANSTISGIFINNTANGGYGYGAAIEAGIVSNSTIIGTFINNSVTYYGGAISISRLDNSTLSGTFINNSASYYEGGAINLYGIVNSTISGTFINNSARYYDAIYLNGDSENSKISNSVFISDSISDNIPTENSWFGNNASNYESRPYSSSESWLFLDGSSSPVAGSSGKSNVMFTLDNLYNSSSKLITHPEIPDFSDVVFELTAVNGYLNRYTATPGETVVFTSTVNKDGIVKATVGDYSCSINIANLYLDAPDVNKYYNGTEMFVVTLTDILHNPIADTNVSVTINGRTTEGVSDENGQFSIPLDLNPGNYTVTTVARGVKVFSTVNIYQTILSSDITGVYQNTRFEATILDSTGRPVTNKRVEFIINGLQLSDITDADGVAGVDIDLDVGNYMITITNPVTGQIRTNNVAITKANSTISVTSESFVYGATLTANISPSNLSGEVAFIINGNTYYSEDVVNSQASLTLINLVGGTYNVTASYSGDSNHFGSSVNSTFKVNKVMPTIDLTADDISVGDDLIVNVVLPSDIDAVNVTVGDITQIVSLTNGVGSATFDGLAAGTYNVIASFAGDDRYEEASANTIIRVNKVSTVITVNADSVSYGENLVVGVVLPSDVAYRVNVSVGGMSKLVTLKNGTGNATFKGLKAGTYDVIASYGGDNNYLKSSANTTAKVKKISADIGVSAKAIYYGEDLLVNVVLPSDATYRVNVSVGDMSKLVSLRNGVGNATFSGLTVGTYDVIASYGGDNNYLKSSANTTARVKKISANITINVEDISIGDDLVVDVVLPSDAVYRVNVSVGGMSKLVSLKNGVGSATFKNLLAGTYDVTVSYGGDNNYLKSSANTTVTVNRITADIDVIADAVSYGEDLVVNFVLPRDVIYPITVSLGNVSKTVSLTDGVGSATFEGLNAGTYTIVTTYAGDSKYLESSTNTTVKVNRILADINASADAITYGDDLVVNIQLPDDVTRRVSVTIANKTKYVTLVNGIGNVTFKGVSAGLHNVIISYAGDDNYLKSTCNITAEVAKATPSIEITVNNITYGESLTVKVKLPADVSQSCTVIIGSELKNVTLKKGVGTVKFNGLYSGFHIVNVFYEGDENYDPMFNYAMISVKAN